MRFLIGKRVSFFLSFFSARKYVEPFDNGISIITLCLAKAGNKNCGTVSQVLPQVKKDGQSFSFFKAHLFFFLAGPS